MTGAPVPAMSDENAREAGAGHGAEAGFVPPVYPYDKLAGLARLAQRHEGGAVDLSIGTPCDPPPARVLEALAGSGTERGYPSSIGSSEYREAALAWMSRRFGVDSAGLAVAACVGTKELVAGVPHWLRLRTPARDTVLCPLLAYPTYEMGAILARCRAVAVPARPDGTMELSSISPADASRALCLWVNSPGNPAGRLEDLAAVASWGRSHGVPVFSDECYVEFTWAGPGHTILEHGPEGVVAVHSLSKRSNLAGLRAGFFAGDADLVGYLSRLRQHAGFMVPGPVQHAGAVALGDDSHVEHQRETYLARHEASCRSPNRQRCQRRDPRRVLLPLGGRSRGFRATRRNRRAERGMGTDEVACRARWCPGRSWRHLRPGGCRPRPCGARAAGRSPRARGPKAAGHNHQLSSLDLIESSTWCDAARVALFSTAATRRAKAATKGLRAEAPSHRPAERITSGRWTT